MTAVTARTVTITLPLPPIALSPNSRAHYLTKATKAKGYRSDAYHAALAAVQPGSFWFWHAVMDVRYTRCPNDILGNLRRVCPTDQDNAMSAIKNAIDGVRDAGIIVNDTSTHLVISKVEITRCKHSRNAVCSAGGKSGVTLVFTEIA